jgi:hypothetical protein
MNILGIIVHHAIFSGAFFVNGKRLAARGEARKPEGTLDMTHAMPTNRPFIEPITPSKK